MNPALQIELPAFLDEANASDLVLADAGARMDFVLGLVAANVAAGGGPFAAAVFEHAGGRLLAAGTNRVVPGRCSTAHAEVMALSLAQQRLGRHDLGASATAYELVSSAEPCAMCIGAILWSGVRHLVFGATGADIAAIGFDEGPKHPDWADELRARGITVTGGLRRDQAAAQLAAYARGGGAIYNARQAG